jgi:hypothetical protein
VLASAVFLARQLKAGEPEGCWTKLLQYRPSGGVAGWPAKLLPQRLAWWALADSAAVRLQVDSLLQCSDARVAVGGPHFYIFVARRRTDQWALERWLGIARFTVRGSHKYINLNSNEQNYICLWTFKLWNHVCRNCRHQDQHTRRLFGSHSLTCLNVTTYLKYWCSWSNHSPSLHRSKRPMLQIFYYVYSWSLKALFIPWPLQHSNVFP